MARLVARRPTKDRLAARAGAGRRVLLLVLAARAGAGRRVLLLVLAALALVGAACSLGDVADDPGPLEAVAEAPDVEAEPDLDSAHEPARAPDDGGDVEAREDAAAGEDALLPLPPEVRQIGRTAERVAKEGTVTLEVEEGAFLAAREAVVDEARRLGGWVAGITSTTDDQGRATASVTVRVPVDRYEDLLNAVSRIARPVAETIRSEEVGGQIVDLRARLRHLRAQESFYLGLLDDARDVQDAIAVQRQVEDLQQRIEQLQGRLEHLGDRADYSTLTVELVEAGAVPVLASDREPTLAAYWAQARNGFVTIVGWTLVVSVTLAPIAVPLALAFAAWRLTARRRPDAPATVAADAD